MGEDSKIAWTHHTFNPWIGCSKVSPGCTNCYAEAFAVKRMKLPVWGVNADRKPMSEAYWKQPLKWDRDAHAAGERRRVFCASMADVFEVVRTTPDNTAAWTQEVARARLWALIDQTPHLDWLLLTKRPKNVARLVPWAPRKWPSNVWLGVTAEDQKRADERIPILLSIPARVRFVSYEPALEAVDFPGLDHGPQCSCEEGISCGRPTLDWVIVGGESGPKARSFDLAWARSTIAQCRRGGVPVFVKQLGTNPAWLRDRKGGDPYEWPVDLRVREFPR